MNDWSDADTKVDHAHELYEQGLGYFARKPYKKEITAPNLFPPLESATNG